MANKSGKTIDKTYLSINHAEERGFLHRDYIAHCLRWSHAMKLMGKKSNYKTARVLDIGCGKEVPFARTLYSSRMSPQSYTGIDIGKIPDTDINQKMEAKFDLFLYENHDFAKMTFYEYYDFVTCFEVLEHVEPSHAIAILENLKQCITIGTDILLSTPCWDPHVGAADNHVNEMKYEVFGSLLERHNYQIINHFGTFASIKDYIHEMLEPECMEMFNRLRDYYDTNYLATIFAPLFPQHARNCLWHVRLSPHDDFETTFPLLTSIEKPWTSSERWEDLKT